MQQLTYQREGYGNMPPEVTMACNATALPSRVPIPRSHWPFVGANTQITVACMSTEDRLLTCAQLEKERTRWQCVHEKHHHGLSAGRLTTVAIWLYID